MLEVLKYALDYRSLTDGGSTVSLERVGGIGSVFRWAIRCNEMCMDGMGNWEWEPRPSCRDDAFMARCRFRTVEDALKAWLCHGANPTQAEAPAQPTTPPAVPPSTAAGVA